MPPQDIYLESQVLTAEPIELVRLLYRAAGDAVRSASAHLAAGRILERSQQVNKAYAILSELTVTLDPARGGTLSHSLAELYDYMQRRLLEANRRQQPEPLAEVERLLATLQEGWDQIQTNPEESRLARKDQLAQKKRRSLPVTANTRRSTRQPLQATPPPNMPPRVGAREGERTRTLRCRRAKRASPAARGYGGKREREGGNRAPEDYTPSIE